MTKVDSWFIRLTVIRELLYMYSIEEYSMYTYMNVLRDINGALCFCLEPSNQPQYLTSYFPFYLSTYLLNIHPSIHPSTPWSYFTHKPPCIVSKGNQRKQQQLCPAHFRMSPASFNMDYLYTSLFQAIGCSWDALLFHHHTCKMPLWHCVKPEHACEDALFRGAISSVWHRGPLIVL